MSGDLELNVKWRDTMKQPLRILIVEDSEDDVVFVIRELKRGGYEPVFERVETAPAFQAALAQGGWDAIIADFNLPQFNAPEALRLLQESRIDLPFIIVSGAIGEEVAVAAMKSGAHDYILKKSLARLMPAVERELRDARVRHERRDAETSLTAFSKLGQSLASTSTFLDAARLIGSIADELFHWDGFTLDSYSDADGQIHTVLKMETVAGVKQDAPPRSLDGAPSDLARRIIDAGAELILRQPGKNNAVAGEDASSLMFAPIRYRTKVIGILSVQSGRSQAYDDRSLKMLQTLADYCGGALERIRARDELRRSQQQLRALAAHLQSVREEERKMMTREIHDELGQSLTGFKMDLAWIRNRLQSEGAAVALPPILDKIKVMGGLLDDTATLMRKLCTQLRPGVLDDLGLVAAIEWQAGEYHSRTGIICEVHFDLGDLEVEPERSTALFRIFQETLTNIGRHARATRVDASLKRVGNDLLLEVKDNGRGIKQSEIAGSKSLGLLGMRERALILGGEVEIKGSPGKGTKVTVKMPLPKLSEVAKNAQ